MPFKLQARPPNRLAPFRTRKEKGSRHRGWNSYLDALIGDEEQKKRKTSEKRKGVEAQRAKPSTPSQASDAHIGDEEQNRKTEKERKRERVPNPTTQEHLVAFYDLYG